MESSIVPFRIHHYSLHFTYKTPGSRTRGVCFRPRPRHLRQEKQSQDLGQAKTLPNLGNSVV